MESHWRRAAVLFDCLRQGQSGDLEKRHPPSGGQCLGFPSAELLLARLLVVEGARAQVEVSPGGHISQQKFQATTDVDV